jgi:hypothetical protein
VISPGMSAMPGAFIFGRQFKQRHKGRRKGAKKKHTSKPLPFFAPLA